MDLNWTSSDDTWIRLTWETVLPLKCVGIYGQSIEALGGTRDDAGGREGGQR